jgi:hypothetical protein
MPKMGLPNNWDERPAWQPSGFALKESREDCWRLLLHVERIPTSQDPPALVLVGEDFRPGYMDSVARKIRGGGPEDTERRVREAGL